MLPHLRSEWPNLKLYLREETSQAACDALQPRPTRLRAPRRAFSVAASSTRRAVRRRLFVAFPHGEAPSEPSLTFGAIGREPPAPAGGWALPGRPCLSVLQPPELRAGAAMMGTSLHTLVQMVDNGLA